MRHDEMVTFHAAVAGLAIHPATAAAFGLEPGATVGDIVGASDHPISVVLAGGSPDLVRAAIDDSGRPTK